MLTEMFEKNVSFEEALSVAQQLGYAETIDPSADVDGYDAQRKIAILASLAFGIEVGTKAVPTKGISGVRKEDLQAADKAGGTIKLIARCV